MNTNIGKQPQAWATDAFGNVYLAKHITHGHAITGAPPICITCKSPEIWPAEEQFDKAAHGRLLAAAPTLLWELKQLLAEYASHPKIGMNAVAKRAAKTIALAEGV